MRENKTIVEISPRTLIITISIILAFWLAWIIKPVIFMFFIAFILSAAFKPYVNYFEKYKIPRIVSTIVIFVLFLLIATVGLVTVVNEALIQLRALVEQVPNIVFTIISNAEKIFPVISQYIDPDLIKSTLKDWVTSLLNFSPTIVSSGVTGVFDVVNSTLSLFGTSLVVAIMTIFMLVRKDNVYDGLLMLIQKEQRKKYLDLLARIEVKLGEWLRTELFIMLVVGFVVWLGLSLPGLFIPNYGLGSYALPLAFLAMVLEIIPGTGVALAGVVSTIVALALNQPYLALYTSIFFIVLQQAETAYFIPTIMNKVVGVDPIITIIGFISFYILFGPIGAILVVPLLIVIQLMVDFGVDGVVDTV